MDRPIKELTQLERWELALQFNLSPEHRKDLIERIEKLKAESKPKPKSGRLF